MKLADWLHGRSITPEQLRRMLGVTSRSTITRYLSGERVPSPRLLQKIIRITQGQVNLDDFLDTGPPKCAQVIEDKAGTPKLVFPWSRGVQAQEKAFEAVRAEPADGEGLTSPLVQALAVLGERAVLTRRGAFLLDGRVSEPKRLVTEANAVLVARGEPPIAYPGVHRRMP